MVEWKFKFSCPGSISGLLIRTWYWPTISVIYRNQFFHLVSQWRLKLAKLSWYFQHLFWPQIFLFSVLFSALSYFCPLIFLSSHISAISYTSLCSSAPIPPLLFQQLLLTNTEWVHTTWLVINYWIVNPYTIVRWDFLGSCASDLK